MQKEQAEILVDGIKNRSGGIHFEEEKKVELVKLITNFSIEEETDKFHIRLPDSSGYEIPLEEGGVHYTLSLRRILVNRNAKIYRPNILKGAQEFIVENFRDYFKGYNSDVIARKMRENPSLVEAMQSAIQFNSVDHSLLGKLVSVDYKVKEIRPFVVIVGADINEVLKFENEHRRKY